LSGIGVLSLTTSWRDVAYLYFAHASSYKRYNEELEREARKRNQAHIDRFAENKRLMAVNDSLTREMEKIERRIEENKMKFRREVMMDIYGFKRDLSVQRDWERERADSPYPDLFPLYGKMEAKPYESIRVCHVRGRVFLGGLLDHNPSAAASNRQPTRTADP
jgi:hypothetical protein